MFDDTGNGSRSFFCLKSQTSTNYEKEKITGLILKPASESQSAWSKVYQCRRQTIHRNQLPTPGESIYPLNVTGRICLMNIIDINGISFTPESLESLKEWITPEYTPSETLIAVDISSLEKAQSFLLYHWDEFCSSESDTQIKGILTGLQYLKERLTVLSQIGKKGNSNCDQTSIDNQ